MSLDVTWMDVSVTLPLSAENRALFVPPFTLNMIEVNVAEVPCNLNRAVGFVEVSEEKVFVGIFEESTGLSVKLEDAGKVVCVVSVL